MCFFQTRCNNVLNPVLIHTLCTQCSARSGPTCVSFIDQAAREGAESNFRCILNGGEGCIFLIQGLNRPPVSMLSCRLYAQALIPPPSHDFNSWKHGNTPSLIPHFCFPFSCPNSSVTTILFSLNPPGITLN